MIIYMYMLVYAILQKTQINKMRLSLPAWFDRIVYSKRHPPPLKILKPFYLKNHVSGKSRTYGGESCTTYMTAYLRCLEANEYQNTPCFAELDVLNDCFKRAAKESKQDTKKDYLPSPNAERHTAQQITNMLRRYPLK